eukprot:TRINITY_DN4577_c0_g1_i1.p1 TRINITY_DN4577_c0_g1~~TRINITY_DN4577_c0_g1_i1.p1  ORF type:complete len:279 (+),score=45.10 TRINITY_DN4577_c0_g1_i1:386-1222(+)
MHGFSTADGFMEVSECVAEMIKYLANEPSVGLYFVQQHTQNAMPNLLNIKDKVVEKSRETALHTEDLEDSIDVVRSMIECGPPIADEMIKDIKKSLLIMSTSQPRKGLIRNPSLGFQMGRSSSWGPAAFNYSSGETQLDEGSSGSYFSTVLKSAKQRASGLRWPQTDANRSRNFKDKNFKFSPTTPQSVVAKGSGSAPPDTEADELPVSSQMMDEQLHDEQMLVVETPQGPNISLMSENYDKFKSDREAKLEEWLEGLGNRCERMEASEGNLEDKLLI